MTASPPFRHGLIIGKFMPPHHGHRLLIRRALVESSRVTLVVCQQADDPIPADVRASWLRQLYPTATVKIMVVTWPVTESTSWARGTLDVIGQAPDVVFTSEDYGHEFARLLGCQHIQVDRARQTVPVTATQIRQNPTRYRQYLDPLVWQFFTSQWSPADRSWQLQSDTGRGGTPHRSRAHQSSSTDRVGGLRVRGSKSPGSVWRLGPVQFFLILGTFFGFLFLVFVPPFQLSDEPAHYVRAFLMTNGQFSVHRTAGWTGGRIPSVLPAFTNTALLNQNVSTEGCVLAARLIGCRHIYQDTVAASFPTSAVNSPLLYLPAAAGIGLARVLGSSMLMSVWFGRAVSLLTWLVIMALAIHVVPIRRWTMAIAALLPMMLGQAAAISADTLTIAGCWLAIAVAARAITARSRFTQREQWGVALAFLLLGFLKPVYLPIGALLLLIPGQRFTRPAHRWWWLIGTWSAMLLVAVGWLFLIRHQLIPLRSQADPASQLHLLLTQPWTVMAMVGRTVIGHIGNWILGMIGIFGWNATHLASGIYAAVLSIGAWIVLIDPTAEPRGIGNSRPLIVGLTIFLLTCLIVIISQFITWTIPGASEITLVQGRYFLPILPLIFLWIPMGLSRAHPRQLPLAVLAWGLTLAATMMQVAWLAFVA